MIKRKELVDYANSKRIQALRVSIDKKKYISLEISDALLKCGFAIRSNKRANKDAYELSKKHYDELYQYGYEQFLNDTLEASLSKAYIYTLSIMEMQSFDVNFNNILKLQYLNSVKAILFLMSEIPIGDSFNKKDINRLLFHIECFAMQWNIDLHYYVDIALENMEYNSRLNL